MNASVVCFGVFQLRISSKELRKHGVPMRLSGHPLAVLLVLLEQPGEIVTREEIQKRLWRADTFVDFEHGLNTAIKKLRGVLGDSADSARYIETIPRVGYRFIAPVQDEAGADGLVRRPGARVEQLAGEPAMALRANGGAALEPLPPVAQHDKVRPGLSVIRVVKRNFQVRHAGRWVATLAAAALIIVIPRMFVSAARAPEVVNVQALTNTSRIESFGEIETDGARLFFLERKGHKWNLMQMPASGGEAQPFAIAFENTKILAVSPDASEMIVSPFTRREAVLPIYLMPSVGGSPRPVGNISASDAAFTADGQEITYATADGIYRVRRDGMNPRLLAALPGQKTDLDWSPDGRTLRFTRGALDGDPTRDNSELWEMDAASGAARAVLPGWDVEPMQCCGKWTADGKYFAFVSHNHGGSPHVWMLERRRGVFALRAPQPIELSSGPVLFNKLLSGRDGRHLFALGFNGRNEYVAVDPQSQTTHTLLGGSSAAWISFPTHERWTVSERSDGAIWKSQIDGSEAALLVPSSLRPTMPSVSADGAELVFEADPDNSHLSRAYVVGTESGGPRLLVSGNFSAVAPQLAPDRSAVVYAAADTPSGALSLHVMDRKTGVQKLLAGSAGMRISRWSPDGKYLAALSEDNSRIAVLDLRTQRWKEIAKGKVFGPPSWARDSRSLYYQDVLEAQEPIHQVGINGHALNSFPACGDLLVGNVLRCGFEALSPEGAFVLQLTRGDHDLFSLELKLP
jgi:DNA-binding winged helix-turn-helix (wHTH) protein/Tol biopolymer transport system component